MRKYSIFVYLLISLFSAVLGRQWCLQAFASCSEQRLLSSCSAQACHCVGFPYGRAWAPEWGLSTCGHGLSCSAACGIFPDQGSNPALADGFLTTGPPGKSKMKCSIASSTWDMASVMEGLNCYFDFIHLCQKSHLGQGDHTGQHWSATAWQSPGPRARKQ